MRGGSADASDPDSNHEHRRAESRERVQLITSIRRSGPLTRLDRSDATWLTGLTAETEPEAEAEAESETGAAAETEATLRSYTF